VKGPDKLSLAYTSQQTVKDFKTSALN